MTHLEGGREGGMQVISKLMCFLKSWFNSYVMTFSFFMKKGPTLASVKTVEFR